MKSLLSLLLFPLLIACSTSPQPLVVGQDVCFYCKMPVVDSKFGAEVITAKGKLYKFDDVGCMSNFLKSGFDKNESIKTIVAVCYTNNNQLLDVQSAFFLRSPALHSPMNSGIAAFNSKQEATSMQKNFPGEILSWEQIQQQTY